MPTSGLWRGGVDALRPDALAGADLPAGTKQLLADGVPREVRLPGWLGPTLFSSELRAGTLLELAHFAPTLEHHPLARALVVGSIRETEARPTAYAAFCLQPGTGTVWLIDLDEPYTVRFVNGSLDLFLRCVRAFLGGWARSSAIDADLPAIARELRATLSAIDAEAFADPDRYWPIWLETELDVEA